MTESSSQSTTAQSVYIFISYSHRDSKYAHSLAKAFKKYGHEVWLDERLNWGDQWPQAIQEQLDNCSAFAVIMSSNSSQSVWVRNELARAMRKRKRIFPLLLEGNKEPWIELESTQHLDVRDGKLPPQRFFEQVGSALQR